MTAVYKAIAGVAKDLSEVGISKDSRNQQQGKPQQQSSGRPSNQQSNQQEWDENPPF